MRGSGEVAVVATPTGLALLGGGQEPGERLEAAAARETAEECGPQIAVCRLVGVADERVNAEGERTSFRKRCTSFLAEVTRTVAGAEAGDDLRWLPPESALASLQHGRHRWAVARACVLR